MLDISGILLYLTFATIQSYRFFSEDDIERQVNIDSSVSDYALTVAMFAGLFRALTSLLNLNANTRFVM